MHLKEKLECEYAFFFKYTHDILNKCLIYAFSCTICNILMHTEHIIDKVYIMHQYQQCAIAIKKYIFLLSFLAPSFPE